MTTSNVRFSGGTHDANPASGQPRATPAARIARRTGWRRLAAAGSGLAILLSGNPVLAQGAYPTKPIKFVVPFPPGGSSDVLARLLGQKLSEGLAQPVTIENRPGAGGNIGAEYMTRQAPDGYNIVLGSSTQLATNIHLYKRLGYDPISDFTPVAMVAVGGSILVVHPSVPVKTVAEMIALARAQPGKLNYGSGGVGTPAHVIGESFKSVVGVDLTHVPYKGTGVAVVDLVAGQLDLIFSDMVPTTPQVKAGKLRPLAVTGDKRSALFPEVPTLAESGINLTVGQTWWAILGPKGMPDAVVKRLNAETEKILKQPDLIERYSALGIATHYTTPEGVLERIRRDSPEFGKVLRAAGVQPE